MKVPQTTRRRPAARMQMTAIMLERMKKIHLLLLDKAHPTTRQLAEQFEVSVRTIKRDLEMMTTRMNLPIASRGKEKEYYYDAEVTAFPNVILTEGELVSMVVAANALHGSLFGGLGVQVTRLLEKLAESLPETVTVNLADWEDAISFHYFGEPLFDLQIFHKLMAAIANRKRLKVTYHTPGAVPGERLLDPYGMAFINREWVLFAYCHKRAELRRFIPPRMSEVSETGASFVRPGNFRLSDHLVDTFGVYNSDVLHDVVIRFDKCIAHETRERRWPRQHRLEALPDGSVNLHLKLSHLHDIHEFILARGGNAYPLGPKELCDMYNASVEKMSSRRQGVKE